MALFLVAAASDASAQSLGALAAKADEERRARPADKAISRNYGNGNLPAESRLAAALKDFELTMEMYQKYITVHTWLRTLRQRSAGLDTYLAAFNDHGAARPPFGEQLTAFHEIVDALDYAGLTTLEFELVHAALERAMVDALGTDSELTAMPPARLANARWARKSQTYISGMSSYIRREMLLPPGAMP